jgi:hypothetical protein
MEIALAWGNGIFNTTTDIMAASGLTADDIKSYYGIDDSTMDWLVSQGDTTADTTADTTVVANADTTADTTAVTTADTATNTNADTTSVASNLADTGSGEIVSTNLNNGDTTDSSLVGDSGGLDSVADILASLNTDAGDTALDATDDTELGTTLNAAADTTGDTTSDTTIGGLNTLNADLTGGSNLVSTDTSADTGAVNAVLNNDVVGGLSAVTGSQGDQTVVADDVAAAVADQAEDNDVVLSEDVVADTNNTSNAANTVGALTQVQTGTNNLNVDSAADATTTGGLNQASNTGSKTDVLGNIVKGAVTKAVTGAVKGAVRGGVNKALGVKTAKTPSFGKQLVGNIGSQIAGKIVPKSIDISKLKAATTKKKVVPTKADISKLTPIKNISGLTSLIKRKG